MSQIETVHNKADNKDPRKRIRLKRNGTVSNQIDQHEAAVKNEQKMFTCIHIMPKPFISFYVVFPLSD
jgi:hypothetical protein